MIKYFLHQKVKHVLNRLFKPQTFLVVSTWRLTSSFCYLGDGAFIFPHVLWKWRKIGCGWYIGANLMGIRRYAKHTLLSLVSCVFYNDFRSTAIHTKVKCKVKQGHLIESTQRWTKLSHIGKDRVFSLKVSYFI